MQKLALALVVSAMAGLCVVAAQAANQPQVSAQDVNYLQSSISGDRFEIIGGRIAMSKSSDSAVRRLAQRLIMDHTKSLHEAMSIAKQLNVKAPDAPTPSEVWELNTVRSLSGSTFDASYSTLEFKDHQQDIEETTFETMHGASAMVKADAKKDLPVLKRHLALAMTATQSLGLSY